MLIDAHSKLLANALVQKGFHCEGTWKFPAEQLQLFYNTGSNPRYLLSCLISCILPKIGNRFISFPTATPDDVKLLSESCQPATFGVNQQDVMDESYRKAKKMDNANFATNLDVHNSGLIELIKTQLLDWEKTSKGVKVELYKLNVYGKLSYTLQLWIKHF